MERSMDERTDVIVVGGGVIGLACALALVRRGRGVRLLEGEALGNGASHGNCGVITPSHAVPLNAPGMLGRVLASLLDPAAPIYVRPRLDLAFLGWSLRFARRCTERGMLESMRGRAALLSRSRELFDGLIESEGLDCEWETRGMLEVFATERAYLSSQVNHRRLADHGVHSEAHLGEALLAFEPALRDGLFGGQHFPGDAHLRPDALVRELGRVVRAAGVQIDERREVTGIEAPSGHATRVTTRTGALAADHVVIATGAWSPRLARSLGLSLPVQPGKGYSITYGRPDPCPRLPCVLTESNCAVTPWKSGIRLGGTMEFAGYDTRLVTRRIQAIRDGAGRYLRQPLGPGEPEVWYGWRPMTPDELPIIDHSPGAANVIVAAGHGMMGVSMAPATAELVADLVIGSEPVLDPSPYSIGRFG